MQPERTVTRGGTTYKQNTAAIGRRPQAGPELPELDFESEGATPNERPWNAGKVRASGRVGADLMEWLHAASVLPGTHPAKNSARRSIGIGALSR
jgi:hypothetical protein